MRTYTHIHTHKKVEFHEKVRWYVFFYRLLLLLFGSKTLDFLVHGSVRVWGGRRRRSVLARSNICYFIWIYARYMYSTCCDRSNNDHDYDVDALSSSSSSSYWIWFDSLRFGCRIKQAFLCIHIFTSSNS